MEDYISTQIDSILRGVDTISSAKIHLDIMIKNLLLNLQHLEITCREYFLKSAMDLTAIALGIAAILVTPMNYLDYRYYGWSWNYLAAALFEVCLLYTSPSPRDRTRSR